MTVGDLVHSLWEADPTAHDIDECANCRAYSALINMGAPTVAGNGEPLEKWITRSDQHKQAVTIAFLVRDLHL